MHGDHIEHIYFKRSNITRIHITYKARITQTPISPDGKPFLHDLTHLPKNLTWSRFKLLLGGSDYEINNFPLFCTFKAQDFFTQERKMMKV